MAKNNETVSGRKVKVLVAIDGSSISDMVIKRSGQYARVAACDLTVLHVVEDVISRSSENVEGSYLGRANKEEGEKILEKARKTLQHYGIECQTKVVTGPVAATILDVAEKGNFDAIFVGSKGFGGIKRMLLGSVADDVTRHAHCSVTVVR
jgi:nucleotide-binding universal stress UspA family protein